MGSLSHGEQTSAVLKIEWNIFDKIKHFYSKVFDLFPSKFATIQVTFSDAISIPKKKKDFFLVEQP